ncbi:hypothetical protein ACFYRC_26270 [Streptomyces sp. NPDC005279]|uniref:hypothetical protein n=1 Tax=Streptomyces sp. NPDC005279 TaxID=3364712 RepID=UPI0036CD3DDC
MRRLAISAAVAAVALLLTGCGESAPAPADDTSISEDATLDDPAPVVDEPLADQAEDPDTTEYLAAAGIDDVMVKRLATIAEANNYAATIPMTPDGAQSLAVRLVDVCRDIAAGEWTYEGHEADDISMGGTPAQAGAMRRFMQATYCPAVQPGK